MLVSYLGQLSFVHYCRQLLLREAVRLPFSFHLWMNKQYASELTKTLQRYSDPERLNLKHTQVEKYGKHPFKFDSTCIPLRWIVLQLYASISQSSYRLI